MARVPGRPHPSTPRHKPPTAQCASNEYPLLLTVPECALETPDPFRGPGSQERGEPWLRERESERRFSVLIKVRGWKSTCVYLEKPCQGIPAARRRRSKAWAVVQGPRAASTNLGPQTFPHTVQMKTGFKELSGRVTYDYKVLLSY